MEGSLESLKGHNGAVLILILVEVALGERTNSQTSETSFVLILILVEVALGELQQKNKYHKRHYSLNPYFSGSCSWREWEDLQEAIKEAVLILILVEVALGDLLGS